MPPNPLPALRADHERRTRLRAALEEHGWEAFICSRPENVLLLSGYWPVVGTSVAIFTLDKLTVVAPEDEMELANDSRADEMIPFEPSELDELTTASAAVRRPLARALAALNSAKLVAVDDGASTTPVSYAAMHLYGSALRSMVSELLPNVHLADAEDALCFLRSRLTTSEVPHVRAACELAGAAFKQAAPHIRSGRAEFEVVAQFQQAFASCRSASNASRQGAFVWCMSGPNSAKAHAAYARTRTRKLQEGDLLMMHCNSCDHGFWTDITRTFHLGAPSERVQAMYVAIWEAMDAALPVIRSGARGTEVDHAAREVLTQRGFGKEFKHATGHGVGYAAISADARPRLHPKSPDVLEAGMIFNVEPAIYIEGFGGIRQCNVVLATENGSEVLTDFQQDWQELVL